MRRAVVVLILFSAACSPEDRSQSVVHSPVPADPSETAPRWTSEDLEAAVQAAAEGRLDRLRPLIEKGVPVDSKGTTPKVWGGIREPLLSLAARFGHAAVVEYLLSKGAVLNDSRKTEDDLPEYPETGTALHRAALTGHLEIVMLLVEKGAMVDSPGNGRMREQPLHVAVGGERLDIARFLIARRAKLNDAGGDTGHTPLILAIMHGLKPLARLLVENGADTNFCDRFRRRTLEVAIDSFDVFSNYDEAVHRARNDVQMDIIRLLLENMANIAVKNSKRQTYFEQIEKRFSAPDLPPVYLERKTQMIEQLRWAQTPRYILWVSEERQKEYELKLDVLAARLREQRVEVLFQRSNCIGVRAALDPEGIMSVVVGTRNGAPLRVRNLGITEGFH